MSGVRRESLRPKHQVEIEHYCLSANDMCYEQQNGVPELSGQENSSRSSNTENEWPIKKFIPYEGTDLSDVEHPANFLPMTYRGNVPGVLQLYTDNTSTPDITDDANPSKDKIRPSRRMTARQNQRLRESLAFTQSFLHEMRNSNIVKTIRSQDKIFDDAVQNYLDAHELLSHLIYQHPSCIAERIKEEGQ